jgi:hypothetical protein
LYDACLAEGGDGDAILCSKKYKDFAELFESVESEWFRWFNTKEVSDNYIVFSNSQEAVWFMSDESCWTSPWKPQLIIKY